MGKYNEYDTPFSRLCCAVCPFKDQCLYEGYKDYQREAVCATGLILKTELEESEPAWVIPNRLEMFSLN
jgi:hypothetical protein